MIKSTPNLEVYYDNRTTINIAKDHVHHDRIKHVETDCPSIKESYLKNKKQKTKKKKLFLPIACQPKMQLVDILTKALFKNTLKDLEAKSNVVDRYYPS